MGSIKYIPWWAQGLTLVLFFIAFFPLTALIQAIIGLGLVASMVISMFIIMIPSLFLIIINTSHKRIFMALGMAGVLILIIILFVVPGG